MTGPGSLSPSTAQGTVDGQNAAALMAHAGFPAGSYVYLDIENGPPLQQVQIDYLGTWVTGVEAGGYQPGVYCSWHLAAQIHGLHPQARIWPFHVQNIASHPVPGHSFPTSSPAGSGYTGAYVWQLDDTAVITVSGAPGGTLTVDLDTALSADPSH